MKIGHIVILRKKLLFFNVVLVAAAVLIIGISLYIYLSLNNKINEIKSKYGDEMLALSDFNTMLKSTSKDIKDLSSTVNKKLKTDEDAYLDNVKYAIVGYYNFTGQKKTQEEIDWIGESVRVSFECSEILFAKGAIKTYAPNIRVCAIQNLGEKRVETNFNKDCVVDNYEKTGDGKFLVYKDKSHYVRRIQSSQMCEVFTSDWKKSEAVLFSSIVSQLNVTSTDFGESQVNSVHLKPHPADNIYTTMSKWGVWSLDMNKWIMDPKINCYARIIINEERTADWVKHAPDKCNPRTMDEPGNGHWDKMFVSNLLKVSGWQSVDKYR